MGYGFPGGDDFGGWGNAATGTGIGADDSGGRDSHGYGSTNPNDAAFGRGSNQGSGMFGLSNAANSDQALAAQIVNANKANQSFLSSFLSSFQSQSGLNKGLSIASLLTGNPVFSVAKGLMSANNAKASEDAKIASQSVADLVSRGMNPDYAESLIAAELASRGGSFFGDSSPATDGPTGDWRSPTGVVGSDGDWRNPPPSDGGSGGNTGRTLNSNLRNRILGMEGNMDDRKQAHGGNRETTDDVIPPPDVTWEETENNQQGYTFDGRRQIWDDFISNFYDVAWDRFKKQSDKIGEATDWSTAHMEQLLGNLTNANADQKALLGDLMKQLDGNKIGFNIGGQNVSFTPGVNRREVDQKARLGQSIYDNAANLATTSLPLSQARTTGEINRAVSGDPVLNYLRELERLAGLENVEVGRDKGLALQGRQLDQNEPGMLEYAKGIGSLIGNVGNIINLLGKGIKL